MNKSVSITGLIIASVLIASSLSFENARASDRSETARQRYERCKEDINRELDRWEKASGRTMSKRNRALRIKIECGKFLPHKR